MPPPPAVSPVDQGTPGLRAPDCRAGPGGWSGRSPRVTVQGDRSKIADVSAMVPLWLVREADVARCAPKMTCQDGGVLGGWAVLRFGGAARGGADAVPGWASMLAAPPSAGLLTVAQSRSGGCATRPSASNMLAIPLPSARGKPDLPCAPATPTRRPARHRIGSCHPAGGVPQPAVMACHQQGEKGLGRHLAGRLVGAEERSKEVGT